MGVADAIRRKEQRMKTLAAGARREVAAFDTYAEAQRAVDHLSDRGFPVEQIAIVGQGLRYVEQVTGRLTTARAALLGAAQGALLGAIFGLLAGLLFTLDPNPAVPLLVLYGLVVGAILGAIAGAVAHAMTGGERDFASVSGMDADRYVLLVSEDHAEKAAELLRAYAP
jgi:uncharacterized membrane protein